MLETTFTKQLYDLGPSPYPKKRRKGKFAEAVTKRKPLHAFHQPSSFNEFAFYFEIHVQSRACWDRGWWENGEGGRRGKGCYVRASLLKC